MLGRNMDLVRFLLADWNIEAVLITDNLKSFHRVCDEFDHLAESSE